MPKASRSTGITTKPPPRPTSEPKTLAAAPIRNSPAAPSGVRPCTSVIRRDGSLREVVRVEQRRGILLPGLEQADDLEVAQRQGLAFHEHRRELVDDEAILHFLVRQIGRAS